MESSKIKISTILLCLLFIFFGQNHLSAQAEYDEYTFEGIKDKKIGGISNEETKIAYKISFLLPELGVEVRMAPRFSMDISGKLGINPFFTGGTNRLFLAPYPVFHVEPKWNYNILKREKRGKKTSNFSSNFISLYSSYRIKVSDNNNHALLIGPTWGIQRMMGNFGYFKLNTGLGYFHQFNPTPNTAFPGGLIPVIPIIDVKLGLIF